MKTNILSTVQAGNRARRVILYLHFYLELRQGFASPSLTTSQSEKSRITRPTPHLRGALGVGSLRVYLVETRAPVFAPLPPFPTAVVPLAPALRLLVA